MPSKILRNMTSAQFWDWKHKAITFMGMSGVGKTTLADRLPKDRWFHYSGDYRIGTRYLDEPILDNIKKQAMQVPFLAELLRSDSIYICHNITVDNLAPVSSFMGMIGDPAWGGLSMAEFKCRQALHRQAEIAAMYDVRDFIDKSWEIYSYHHFLNDAGGSLCELDDEAVIQRLAEDTLIIYLKASDDMLHELIERAIRRPKPLYYQEAFFDTSLADFMAEQGLERVEGVPPREFIRWVFPRLVQHRLPRYQTIADNYGLTIDSHKIQEIHCEEDFLAMIATALDDFHH